MKKIIILVLLSFSFIFNNAFAGDIKTYSDWTKTYITSDWEEKILTQDRIDNAKQLSAQEKWISNSEITTSDNVDNNLQKWEEIVNLWKASELNKPTETKSASSWDSSKSITTSNSNWIEVKVTEDIPWAGCTWTDWDYTCTVQPWFGTVMQLMWWIIKYFTFLASLGWVLFIVINWIMLSMGWFWWSKDEIKKRITMTIGWLILLLLSGLILHSIAPWIYR